MTVAFREAMRDDVPAIVAMLRDDRFGIERETAGMDTYYAAFDRLASEGGNTIIVAEDEGRLVATFQLTFISGLSLRATRRAQVESVRVAADLRGRGLGHLMMAEAERRAREAGCALVQLTTHAERNRAREFYAGLGYEATHVGFKKTLI